MTDAQDPAEPDSSLSLDGLESGRPAWARWLWVPAAVALIGTFGWWMNHPPALPASDDTVSATTKAGQTVYVGIVGPRVADEREIHIRDVEIRTLAKGEGVSVKPMICHDGSITSTTEPSAFCQHVSSAKGETLQLGGGDQLILAVSAPTAQSVAVRHVTVSYREGLRFGTQQAGPVVVVDIRG